MNNEKYDCDACGKSTDLDKTIRVKSIYGEGNFCYECTGNEEDLEITSNRAEIYTVCVLITALVLWLLTSGGK